MNAALYLLLVLSAGCAAAGLTLPALLRARQLRETAVFAVLLGATLLLYGISRLFPQMPGLFAIIESLLRPLVGGLLPTR